MRHNNGYDEQGCNNGKCISECRYYTKFGRVEDEEVIQRHKIIAYTLREIILDIPFHRTNISNFKIVFIPAISGTNMLCNRKRSIVILVKSVYYFYTSVYRSL